MQDVFHLHVSRSVGALVPCRRSCARLAQWRPSVLSLPLVSPCVHARFCGTFILTHATALEPSHSNKSYPLHHLQHFWTSFKQFTLLEEEALDGYMWSGERCTRKQLTSRPDHLWPELWKSTGKHTKLKEKQKWSEERIHLDNARKLSGSISSTPRIRNSKKPSRRRAKSWNISGSCYAL